MESIIAPVSVNFAFLKFIDKDLLIQTEKENMPPELCAVEWAMRATSVSRLFTPADFQELLTRLNILFTVSKPIDDWFKQDYLFNYQIGEINYKLTTNDLSRCLGLEVWNTIENFSPRTDFINGIDSRIANSFVFNLLGQNPVIVFESEMEDAESEKIITVSKSDSTSKITEDLIKQSEKLAKELMKDFPKDLFDNTDEIFKPKQENLELRRKLKALSPTFQFNEIPQEIIDQCVEIMYEGTDFPERYMAREEGYDEGIDFMIETAWAYANNLFVIDRAGFLSPSELIADYDYDRMNGLAEESGMEGFMDFWNIEDTVPLLKGYFISDDLKPYLFTEKV